MGILEIICIVLGIIALIMASALYLSNKKLVEKNKELLLKIAKTRKNYDDILFECREIKRIRKEAESKNTILLRKNAQLEKVVNEIEKELEKQNYNSAENLKNKLKSILMTAKSL